MPVVAAGVALSWHLAPAQQGRVVLAAQACLLCIQHSLRCSLERSIRKLLYRQSVHVRPQPDHGLALAYGRNHACSGNVGSAYTCEKLAASTACTQAADALVLDAELVQLLPHIAAVAGTAESVSQCPMSH